MQAIAPPLGERNPNGHTEETILAALRGVTGSRYLTFRYYLLDSANNRLAVLGNVTECAITQNWLADIKRTMMLSMRETGGIDFLSDRIQPAVRLHLPPYGEQDYVEWPQGVFLLVSPKRKASRTGVLTREVQGYDQLFVYTDDIPEDRYVVAAGTAVTTAIETLLNSVIVPPEISLTPSASVLAVAKDWDPGTSKLRMINDLLGMINYESLSFDEDGRAIVQPYRVPSDRPEEYVYADDHLGVTAPDPEQELDLFDTPNKWVLVVSEADQAPLVASYTNNDPTSLTSTVARQRVITDYRIEQEAVDLGVLTLKAQRLAFEASQVYEAIPFKSALMPIHSGNDVYRLTLRSLAVNAVYAEQSWKMTMKAGALMEHVARRVVTV